MGFILYRAKSVTPSYDALGDGGMQSHRMRLHKHFVQEFKSIRISAIRLKLAMVPTSRMVPSAAQLGQLILNSLVSSIGHHYSKVLAAQTIY